MDENKSGKSKKIGKLEKLMACGLIICFIFSGISMYRNIVLANEVEILKNGEPTRENDVVIDDDYKILSTEKLSKAYLEGKTADLEKEDKETVEMAEKVLSKIIKKDMSAYEKEKAVYQWMVKNIKNKLNMESVIPDKENKPDQPHSVLKNKEAVCVGYATTFRLFMEMLEIPCKVIHNNSEIHSWDLVQLDEDWYHVDIFSDSDYMNYSKFNIPDTIMSADQDWDKDFFPAANGWKYNIAAQNQVRAKGPFDIPEAFAKLIKTGKKHGSILFEKNMTEKEQSTAATILSIMDSIIPECKGYSGYNLESSWGKTEDGDILLINMYKDRTDDYEEESNVDEETNREILKAFKKAFKGLNIDIEEYVEGYLF